MKNKLINNFLWRLAERSGAQLVGLVVSVLLARILAPEDYGTISLITIFIVILQVFIDAGLGNALIQKKNADDIDFSTVFFFNICLSGFLYLILFLLSPYIADFFGKKELISLLRVLGINIVIAGVKNIQQAYVSRNMLFKKFFMSTIVGTVTAAVIGILMAYKGFGVWALVAQSIVNNAIDTLILWFSVKWRPIRKFSSSRLKDLFGFGIKLLFSSFIDTIYNNLWQLTIGKKYSSAALAFYSRGEQFPQLIMANINSSLDSVLFPEMSNYQTDVKSIKIIMQKSLSTVTFVLTPVLAALFFCAEEIITLLLTDKWLSSVFYVRVFCIIYAMYPIHTTNLNAIKSVGRADIVLRLEIVKKLLGLIILFTLSVKSVESMALGLLAVSFVSTIINGFPSKKIFDYSIFDQYKLIIPIIALTIISGLAILPVKIMLQNTWYSLILQLSIFSGIYILLAAIFRLQALKDIINIIKSMLLKN